jgi:hypothetical protein
MGGSGEFPVPHASPEHSRKPFIAVILVALVHLVIQEFDSVTSGALVDALQGFVENILLVVVEEVLEGLLLVGGAGLCKRACCSWRSGSRIRLKGRRVVRGAERGSRSLDVWMRRTGCFDPILSARGADAKAGAVKSTEAWQSLSLHCCLCVCACAVPCLFRVRRYHCETIVRYGDRETVDRSIVRLL